MCCVSCALLCDKTKERLGKRNIIIFTGSANRMYRCHAGPHGKAPTFARRQKEQKTKERAKATAFHRIPSGKK